MQKLVYWTWNDIKIHQQRDILDPYLFEVTLLGTTTGYSWNKTDKFTLEDVHEELEGLINGCKNQKIKRVIFNPPATIILWTDGTKSVVKCQNGEEFDAEKGFALAYLKKLLGNDNTFNKEIHKWVVVEDINEND